MKIIILEKEITTNEKVKMLHGMGVILDNGNVKIEWKGNITTFVTYNSLDDLIKISEYLEYKIHDVSELIKRAS